MRTKVLIVGFDEHLPTSSGFNTTFVELKQFKHWELADAEIYIFGLTTLNEKDIYIRYEYRVLDENE